MKKIVNGVSVDLTADEISARQAEEQAWTDAAPARALTKLRAKRNQLLAETDYLALSDNTLSDDMKTYRQNLRDLPDGKDTVEKCDNVTWPTKP